MSLVILSRNHNVISTHLTFMTSSNDICYICTKRLITLLFIVGICSNFQNMPRVAFPLYFNVNYFISIFANKTCYNKDSLKCILEVVHSVSNGYIIVLSYGRGGCIHLHIHSQRAPIVMQWNKYIIRDIFNVIRTNLLHHFMYQTCPKNSNVKVCQNRVITVNYVSVLTCLELWCEDDSL